MLAGKVDPVGGVAVKVYTTVPPGSAVTTAGAEGFTLILKSWTTCVNGLLAAVTKFWSPPYAADIECVPTVRLDVVNVATPSASVPVPNGVEPSRKVTVPVGVPAAEVTVAVRVRLFWTRTGLALLAMATAGVAWFTVRVTGLLAVDRLLPSVTNTRI
jgi:hypothetical protein